VRSIRPLLVAILLLPLSGCFGYRLVRPEEIEIPSYEPREVLIPAECQALIRRAATEGAARLSAGEANALSFCQHQQMIRAQEEEAAARKLEAHSAAASFALQATTVVIGAVIAVLTWVF
jgi:hypothetical protein